MKKFVFIIIIAMNFLSPASAQTYSNLWRQVENAQKASLPKDQLAALSQIESKASKDREYGQLLKAQLQSIAVQVDISPDSLLPQVKKYEQNINATSDAALAAVYRATLAHIYLNCYYHLDLSEEEGERLATEYYHQALADPAALAHVKAKTFEPLAVPGVNSSIFASDLLHLIAFEAEDYDVMVDYYSHTTNRQAACIASLFKLRQERTQYEELKKSKYLAQVDSLIHEYGDLDVAGELAIEHFNVMDSSPDVSAEEKIEFIDDALFRWQNWPRIVVLKNARSRITLPSFNIDIPETLTIPSREIPVHITALKNLQSIFMNVYRLDITGNEEFNPNNTDDYKMLVSKRSDKPVTSDSRTYYGLPEYRELRDTLIIEPLSVGVYLVEFTTDNNSVPTERLLLNITNLRLVDMNLPGDKLRLAVVDATTGKPIPNASIHVKFREWKDKQWQEDNTILRTEDDGEVEFSSTISPYRYRIATDSDNAFPWQSISRRVWNMSSQEKEKTTTQLKLYSDRAIYRPNQTVQASVLAYTVYSQEQWEVAPKKKLTLILRDAKNNIVSQKEATTDEWGVATASFDLPSDAATGAYSLRATDNITSGQCSFRVEEYKRPTFTIDIDPYHGQYKEGDTITVRAYAKTFSSIPVPNAKVEYTVKTELNHWWRIISSTESEELASEQTTTDSQGAFLMQVPIEFPSQTKKGNRFARITVTAQVTSPAGETHSATDTYPLSDNLTAFDLAGFEEKQCREEIKTFSFVYLNHAGQPIADNVSYDIDGQAAASVPTNTQLSLPIASLSSGQHTLHAVCNNDTISQSFIVFSINDKKPPVDTSAWYYSTTSQSRHYVMQPGKAEIIQLGTSLPDQTIFYSIASDTTLLESGQLTLSNELIRREFTYKKEWGNGLAIRYSWVRDGQLYSFSESLSRPVKDCNLSVEFASFRDHLTPGATEEWTIVVKNPDGSPARAQLLAVLYDKSLDAIYRHDWVLHHTPHYVSPVIYQTATYNIGNSQVYGEQAIKYISEPPLKFYTFDFPEEFDYEPPFGMIMPLGTRAMRNLSMAPPMESAIDNMDFAVAKGATPIASAAPEATIDSDIAVRENLTETAFFLPSLVTAKNGDIALRFTLPESLTTWRFMSIAHDKNMNVGSLQAEAVAQKNLMVQPNMPRFLREGDKGQLSTSIANTSDETLSAVATITISEPSSSKTLFTTSQQCTIRAHATTTVTFDLPTDLSADIYTCVITAHAGNLTDGEQHYLPILSSDVDVVTTRAFTQTTAGEHVIDLIPLYGNNTSHESLHVEYTDNPAYLLLDALPSAARPDAENAISLSSALYVTSLVENIKKQLPVGLLLNPSSAPSADELSEKLHQLQNKNGSFSWFNGMHPSAYVTHIVVRDLVRMKHLGFTIDESMLASALTFLDREMAPYIDDLKKHEQETGTKPLPNDFAMDYLYIQALNAEPLTGTARDNAKYLLSCVRTCSDDLTIYGKANFAIIFALHPLEKNNTLAAEFLESVRQYSVYTDEMGRYFDTARAQYSWRNYKIPTQTAAIEAFQTVEPSDHQTISQLQQWLLQEKRTQQWDTPINTASAIYAFFNGWQNFEESSLEATTKPEQIAKTQLFVDGNQLTSDETITGKGYQEATLEGRHRQFVAEKTSDNMSWGAVTVEYSQPTVDVTTDGEYMSITREMLDIDGKPLSTPPAVGQRVKVRITINTLRDLDFVELTDNRPACLEPANQLSAFDGECFVSPRDNKTVYYFDTLAKGKHIVETDYYVNLHGDYTSGIATIKCCYAPEYQAREKSFNMTSK